MDGISRKKMSNVRLRKVRMMWVNKFMFLFISFHFFFWKGTRNYFHKISCNVRSIWCTDIDRCLLEKQCTTKHMRFVKIPIEGVTSPTKENEHQFWGNFCIIKMFVSLQFSIVLFFLLAQSSANNLLSSFGSFDLCRQRTTNRVIWPILVWVLKRKVRKDVHHSWGPC